MAKVVIHAPSSQTHAFFGFAGLLLIPPSLEADARSEYLCGGRGHRRALLSQIQSHLAPSEMLPPRRFETLIEQALQSQVTRCHYHNTPHASLSLFTDYQAGMESLPTSSTQVRSTSRACFFPEPYPTPPSSQFLS